MEVLPVKRPRCLSVNFLHRHHKDLAIANHSTNPKFNNNFYQTEMAPKMSTKASNASDIKVPAPARMVGGKRTTNARGGNGGKRIVEVVVPTAQSVNRQKQMQKTSALKAKSFVDDEAEHVEDGDVSNSGGEEDMEDVEEEEEKKEKEITILFNIWSETPINFHARLARRNTFTAKLEEQFHNIKNNICTPEAARNSIRPLIHNYNPNNFPWGRIGVNM
ncbi:hypothetical protein BD410DRAFT_810272, partial [Rickenella mellea]